MVAWPRPSTTTELRGFLRLTGFYCRFIKGYTSIACPLTTLLRKEHFQWNLEAQSAFDRLKEIMTQAPILASSNFTIPFILETDASGSAMGVVML